MANESTEVLTWGNLRKHVHHGDRVTIVDRFGKQATGYAVMFGPSGWVLNMGGQHGVPALADHTNIVRIVKAKVD